MSHSIHAHDRTRLRNLIDSEVEAAEQADAEARSHPSPLPGFVSFCPGNQCPTCHPPANPSSQGARP